jgi:hypothetical protein
MALTVFWLYDIITILILAIFTKPLMLSHWRPNKLNTFLMVLTNKQTMEQEQML